MQSKRLGISTNERRIFGAVADFLTSLADPTASTTPIEVAQVKYQLYSNLSSANLSDASFLDVNLSKVILEDAKLDRNNLSNANFLDTDVSEVNFKNPQLICEAIFALRIYLRRILR